MKPNLVDYSQFIKKCENPPIRQEIKTKVIQDTNNFFYLINIIFLFMIMIGLYFLLFKI